MVTRGSDLAGRIGTRVTIMHIKVERIRGNIEKFPLRKKNVIFIAKHSLQ